MANPIAALARIPVFFQEVRGEMTKVTWPSRRDLMGATWIVLAVTAILTAYIGILDFVLSKAVSLVLQ